jgi:hypothetical protein
MRWRKLLTLQDKNSDPSVVQPIAIRYADCAILAPVPEGRNKNLCLFLFAKTCVGISVPHEQPLWCTSITKVSCFVFPKNGMGGHHLSMGRQTVLGWYIISLGHIIFIILLFINWLTPKFCLEIGLIFITFFA